MIFLEKYPETISESEMHNELEHLSQKAKGLMRTDVLRTLFSLLDLTTLNHTDTALSGAAFAQKVNQFAIDFPEMPSVAAICVYPTLVESVAQTLNVESVEIASVVGSFPSSQTFLEIKTAETQMAIEAGATEVDMVISVGEMKAGNLQLVYDEIVAIKAAADPGRVKVILETGSLSSQQIWQASLVALEAGADFIKTSTGKTEPAASPEAAWIMCKALDAFYKKNAKMAGFKPAGGVRTSADALVYFTIVQEILGEKWLNPEWFRIGASGLANNLLHDIAKLENKGNLGNYF